MGGKYVVRKPELIVEEMASLPEEINLVCFADDNTLQNIRRAWRLSDQIKERKIQKKICYVR